MKTGATLWLVSDSEMTEHYHDVIGAVTAEDAARTFMAAAKAEQVEEIAYGKRRYEELKAAGEITEPWSQSGFPVNIVLPTEIVVVPMKSSTTYHDRGVATDRKYQSQAFDSLWDWDGLVKVKL